MAKNKKQSELNTDECTGCKTSIVSLGKVTTCSDISKSKSSVDPSPSPINIETNSPIDCNVLLIGLCYNKSVIKQMEQKKLTSILECTDMEGKPLEQSVVRDTWRCHEIGKTYHGAVITTCNILEDRMREEMNSTNINANCC